MRKFLTSAVLALTFATASAADVPTYIGKRTSSPQDKAAIEKVIEEFKSAIKNKNARLLTSLMLNAHVQFEAPPPPEVVKQARANVDANFDGWPVGGYGWFAEMIASSKNSLEERFYNVKITQDGHLAWVMFDYDFLVNGKPENHGLETWQMIKTADGKWKIASVIWTQNLLK
jgi:ketosteroid isomerase-like protein